MKKYSSDFIQLHGLIRPIIDEASEVYTDLVVHPSKSLALCILRHTPKI